MSRVCKNIRRCKSITNYKLLMTNWKEEIRNRARLKDELKSGPVIGIAIGGLDLVLKNRAG